MSEQVNIIGTELERKPSKVVVAEARERFEEDLLLTQDISNIILKQYPHLTNEAAALSTIIHNEVAGHRVYQETNTLHDDHYAKADPSERRVLEEESRGFIEIKDKIGFDGILQYIRRRPLRSVSLGRVLNAGDWSTATLDDQAQAFIKQCRNAGEVMEIHSREKAPKELGISGREGNLLHIVRNRTLAELLSEPEECFTKLAGRSIRELDVTVEKRSSFILDLSKEQGLANIVHDLEILEKAHDEMTKEVDELFDADELGLAMANYWLAEPDVAEATMPNIAKAREEISERIKGYRTLLESRVEFLIEIQHRDPERILSESTKTTSHPFHEALIPLSTDYRLRQEVAYKPTDDQDNEEPEQTVYIQAA